MQGPRIEMAREALRLFLQSLPVGSRFDVINFGAEFNSCSEGEGYHYDEVSLSNIKKYIDTIGADMGGTAIYEPMEFVYQN